MDETTLRWLIGGECAAVAALCMVCTLIITPKRTYYPLLRLFFAITSFIYTATGVSQIYHGVPTQTLRFSIIAAALLMLILSTAFIIRRNRLPQWVSTDWKGTPVGPIDAGELDHCVLTTLSLVRHGAASVELIGQMRLAMEEWERQERWKRHDLPRQFRDRWEARQRANAAQEVVTTEQRQDARDAQQDAREAAQDKREGDR